MPDFIYDCTEKAKFCTPLQSTLQKKKELRTSQLFSNSLLCFGHENTSLAKARIPFLCLFFLCLHCCLLCTGAQLRLQSSSDELSQCRPSSHTYIPSDCKNQRFSKEIIMALGKASESARRTTKTRGRRRVLRTIYSSDTSEYPLKLQSIFGRPREHLSDKPAEVQEEQII